MSDGIPGVTEKPTLYAAGLYNHIAPKGDGNKPRLLRRRRRNRDFTITSLRKGMETMLELSQGLTKVS
ncbi:MAG: hypothetical protein V7L26_04100 [Nostoc sp.]|uniref:hypothetical protein n=1 Tax=Nostoc sp. TaxID=1180 RepID=UPI002FF00D9A